MWDIDPYIIELSLCRLRPLNCVVHLFSLWRDQPSQPHGRGWKGGGCLFTWCIVLRTVHVGLFATSAQREQTGASLCLLRITTRKGGHFSKATTSMNGVCSIWHIHHPRSQVTLGAFIVPVSPNPWQMKFAKCAASPSSLPRMRYSQCVVSPSSLLRDEVYPVCGEPLIPSKDEV